MGGDRALSAALRQRLAKLADMGCAVMPEGQRDSTLWQSGSALDLADEVREKLPEQLKLAVNTRPEPA